MLNLKKTVFAVCAISSSAVFAGSMGPVCTPGSVTVPCAHSAWDFAGQALYLKPAASNHGFLGSNSVNGVEQYNREKFTWGWGFKLEGSYHFNTGNDLNLNWYHMNESFNQPTVNTDISNALSFARTYGINTVKPQWNAVNLEFGQHVDMGEFVGVRFHEGFAYARVQTKRDFTGTGVPFVGASTPFYATLNKVYNGVGPRLGADTSYNFGNGFSLYGNAATALFVGTGSFNKNISQIPGGFPLPVGSTQTGSQTYIVPELEAKLGVTYTYAMVQGDLSLDAGWMWINYFNAQHEPIIVAGIVESSDFGLQGPYIGLKWVGNIA